MHAVWRGENGDPNANRAIGKRRTSLLQIVEGVAPLNSASEQTLRIEAARKDHETRKKRIVACGRATVSLDLLVSLGKLAQSQVDTLRPKLHNRSEHWRRAMYRNATTFAPDLTGTGDHCVRPAYRSDLTWSYQLTPPTRFSRRSLSWSWLCQEPAATGSRRRLCRRSLLRWDRRVLRADYAGTGPN